MSLEVALFPCLSDNYGFLLHDPKTGETAAIDTPDAREIAKVKGPEQDSIPARDETLSGGDSFEFASHRVDVIHTPGHTDEHIIYHSTPEQMWESLSKIMALPETTKLYCAHEYTLSNGKFAISLDGDNPNLLAAITEAKSKREQGLPTVPTTVAIEKRANPFVTSGSAEELGRRRSLKDNF